MGNPRRNRSNQIPVRDGSRGSSAGLGKRLAGALPSAAQAARSGSGRARALLSAAAAGTVALVAVAGWLLWPAGTAAAKVLPPSRERTYAAYTACLLTGPLGLEEPGAPAVWTGMQLASTADAVQVRYQPVIGADTEANAATYLNTLASSNCDVVVAQGGAEDAALAARAAAFPAVRFVSVGGSRPTGANVTFVTETSSSATATAGDQPAQTSESSQVASAIEAAQADRAPAGSSS